MVYFTRTLAKRIKTNHEIEKWAVNRATQLEHHYNMDFWLALKLARHQHPDSAFDMSADYDADTLVDNWVDTMRDMADNFCFDTDVLRRLHPEVYIFAYTEEIEEFHTERAQRIKLNWIFNQLSVNPLIVDSL